MKEEEGKRGKKGRKEKKEKKARERYRERRTDSGKKSTGKQGFVLIFFSLGVLGNGHGRVNNLATFF